MEIFHENEAPQWFSQRALALGIGVKGLIFRYDIPKTFLAEGQKKNVTNMYINSILWNKILLLSKIDLILVARNSRLFLKSV